MAKSPRVLVIEDELLIAMQLETIVRELGCECVGPVTHFDHALNAAETADVDCAILNILLGDKLAYPIAEVLEKRGIPFGFASGVLETSVPSKWAHHPFIDKPYGLANVERLVETVLKLSRERQAPA